MTSCFLTFQAIYNTQFGQELYVVGNHPVLGSWDCHKALHMVTTKHDYPSWRACHKITLPIGFRLEFKLCVREGHTFKRWENFPADRNRHYTTDSRYVKLKVVQGNLELMVERKYRQVSSDEILAGEIHPTRKYRQNNDSEEDSEGSSGNEFDEFEALEPVRDRADHKVLEFIQAFQGSLQFGVRTTKHPYLKHYTHQPVVPVRRNNQTYVAWHFLPAGRQVNKQLLRTQLIEAEKMGGRPERQRELARYILQRVQSQRTKSFPALVLHGIQFAMLPRNLRMLVGDTRQLAIVVMIDAVSSLLQPSQDPEDILETVESLLFTQCLIFTSYGVFQQFLVVLQRLLLQFTVKGIGLYEFVIISDVRPVYVRVSIPSASNSDNLSCGMSQSPYCDMLQLPVFESSENPQSALHLNITESFQKVTGMRMLVFSFGQHESLEMLLSYKDELNKLSQCNLIYVFTPKSLSSYAQLINHFPHVVFISATYMQLCYKGEHHWMMPHQRRGQRVFPREFRQILKEQVESLPGVSVSHHNNVLYVRLEEDSRLALEFYEALLIRLDAVIRHCNESNHESLIATRLNTTTIEIRQAYQTKMFLTNLIFKSSVSSIGFMALFMINRFENFKYFKQLRHVLEIQQSLSSVNHLLMQKADFFGFVVSPIKTERVDILSQTNLLELLRKMIVCERQEQQRDTHRSYSARTPIFTFKGNF